MLHVSLGCKSLELTPCSPQSQAGGRRGQGSHSFWEAAVGMPCLPLCPSLQLGPAAGSTAACQCGLAELLLRGHRPGLDRSASPWSLELPRRWEVRDRRHDSR